MRTTVVSLRFQLLRLLALALAALLLFTACKSKAERVQEQLDLGQRYLTELNYTEAIIAFTEAIEIDPESIPAYMGRAKAYSGTEQYEEAKTDYTTVIDKTAEQPYTQAEAYLGRGEVNELTADDRAALADYQTAADVLEAADPEKITDVTQQMVEALKIRIYNAYARLSAFFGQHEAAVTAYTGALNSLALLPDDADVLDVPEAKVTSYSGRAASNLELEAYEAVLPDYDALIELGEDKISERDILLAALSLAHSQAEDLGASDAWLEEVDHLDYAESIEMNTMLDILSQTAVLAAENGEDAYEDIQELVTSEEAAQAMRNLLTRGYQLRFYNDNGQMLAIYVGETAWSDVHNEENGLVTAEELAQPATAPTEEELEAVSLDSLYIYYGGCEGRSREGEGIWYILNPGSRDYEVRSYDWENDEPVGGFAQQPVRQAAPASTASTAPAAPQWVAVQTSDTYEGESRVTTVTYAIGATSFRYYEVWTRPDGTTEVTSDDTFIANQPVQRFEALGNGGGVLYFPTGTVVTNPYGYQWTVAAGRQWFEMAGGYASYSLYLDGI